MRIALVSTCAVSTPPEGYGGTELVVAELADELTALGHDVTTYATADSTCAGRRRSLFPRPVWPPNDLAELRHTAFAWHDIARRGFDVVHLHHAMGIPFARFVDVPVAATLHHDRVTNLVEHYRAYSDIHYVAISQRQAELASEMTFTRVIHHGLDVDGFPEGDGKGGYVAFLGRFAAEKGPHLAIDAAAKAGAKLRLGGTPQGITQDFYEREVAPRIARHADLVTELGEVVLAPKLELLRRAECMLFPIDWEEPFGLVMIEAMLVGTPVIAFPRGAAPEVVEDGVTGFLVNDVDEMAARIADARRLDRRACRARARERFSSTRMARDYVELYEQLVAERWPNRARLAQGTAPNPLVAAPVREAKAAGGRP